MRRSQSQFGLTAEEWTAAKGEIRGAILDAAYDRRMTTYGEIADLVQVVKIEPFSALMNHLLGAVWEDEYKAGRPALTSIVTHKYGDKEPGTGFREMARELGYRVEDPLLFWAEQVQQVFKMYGKPNRRS